MATTQFQPKTSTTHFFLLIYIFATWLKILVLSVLIMLYLFIFFCPFRYLHWFRYYYCVCRKTAEAAKQPSHHRWLWIYMNAYTSHSKAIVDTQNCTIYRQIQKLNESRIPTSEESNKKITEKYRTNRKKERKEPYATTQNG